MEKIDIVFVAHNRLAFTKEAYTNFIKRTNFNLVDSVLFYDDNSIDGTKQFLEEEIKKLKIRSTLLNSRLQYPVAIMNHFLYELKTFKQPIFAKIDNDVIVPPGWLDTCVEIMEKNPKLDLLGIEPTWSRTQAPWQGSHPAVVDPKEIALGPSTFIPSTAIGGIGLMRKDCFYRHDKMIPHSKYGGFTDWQWKNKDIIKGWAAPALKLFLLDRLPMNPWKELSLGYIERGWQRAWTDYTEEIAHLWDWWEPAFLPKPASASS